MAVAAQGVVFAGCPLAAVAHRWRNLSSLHRGASISYRLSLQRDCAANIHTYTHSTLASRLAAGRYLIPTILQLRCSLPSPKWKG
uniref:Putative secreted protein n=1 Tax=Ixodes ricinus TaxID=34613 RepID=A0A6B0U941_IXORI